MAKLLEGKVVVMTGAARGIGAESCRIYAQHGANVVVNYSHSEDKARQVVEDVERHGGKGIAVRADVRNFDEVKSMFDRTLSEFGRIDGVVNNAISGRQDGAFDDLSDEDFRNMFDFGCLAVANTVRAVRPTMKEQGGGRIVNIVTSA